MKSRIKELKTVRYISLLLTVCAMSLFSCTSDIEEFPDGESLITFSLSFPENEKAASRVGKEAFDNDDKIYITATITTNTEGVQGIVCKTTVMTYNSGSWTQDGDMLTWPKDAVSGSFRAYYLPKTGDSGTVNTFTGSECTIKLEDLRNATDDPLMATKDNIAHNGVVNLQFAHMLTRLNITGLKAATRSVTFRCEEYPLNDRIVFTYDATNGYRHEIMEANDDKGLTMNISATATSTLFFVDMNNSTEWEYNLSNFKLEQRNIANELVIDPTSLSESTIYNMQRGRAYTIYFYSGSDNAAFKENENWYTDKTAHTPFEREEDIVTYFADLTPEGLLEDLDFNNIPLSEGLILFQSTTRGITLSSSFNGNNHTIRNINVANGLFNSIPAGCTVEKLRLENVTITADADDGTECAGALAPVNMGTIKNVRIEGKNFISSFNVPYVGGLVGRNEGTITGVVLSGAFTMDCYADELTDKPFCVGGIAGANGTTDTGSYEITNTEITAAMIINASGTLNTVDAYIGGFAGYNAAAKSTKSSSAHVIVNAKDMKAVNCHTGGFIGLNHGKLSSCNASGDVIGGSGVPGSGEETQRSTTGGFVGYTTSTDIINSALFATMNGCSASGDVFESNNNGKDSFIGGFCGFSEIELMNSSSVGKITTHSTANSKRKAGAFVGIISADKAISNSFSMSLSDSEVLTFNGNGKCLTNNCHYESFKLEEGIFGDPAEKVTANYLNNAGISEYWEWTSSATTYKGAPYLIKK